MTTIEREAFIEFIFVIGMLTTINLVGMGVIIVVARLFELITWPIREWQRQRAVRVDRERAEQLRAWWTSPAGIFVAMTAFQQSDRDDMAERKRRQPHQFDLFGSTP